MEQILTKDFFRQDTLKVAQNLIGKYLVVRTKNSEKSAMITEVEAYDGPHDKASHAHKGKTKRTEIMFGSPGCWYVYLIYGMYWMLNIVTGPEGYPAAVLIRGLEKIDGPGKITKNLGIDNRFNGKPANRKTGLWIEDREKVIDKDKIKKTSRIGVEYAGRWKDKPYRFIINR